ncbi:hypothetical protein Aperf_G00000109304 [Anoplocephala perfoliata]
MSEDEIEEEEDEYLGVYEGGRNEKGERHGFGKAILPNHDTYEGMYENGLRNGKGYYLFKNGARYLGEYLDNRKHGKGTFYYPDGSRYEGYWVDDKRNGYGSYYYVNGDTYEGEWRDHVRHGKGTYCFAATGCKYIGVWRDGKMDGAGEVINPKYRFAGTWRKGQLFGEGTYTFDKLNCQQTGNYLIFPGEPGERQEGDADGFKVSRWRAESLEPSKIEEPFTENDLSEKEEKIKPEYSSQSPEPPHIEATQNEPPAFAQNTVDSVVENAVPVENCDAITSPTPAEEAPIETSENVIVDENEDLSD